jgi:hypothetical protein
MVGRETIDCTYRHYRLIRILTLSHYYLAVSGLIFFSGENFLSILWIEIYMKKVNAFNHPYIITVFHTTPFVSVVDSSVGRVLSLSVMKDPGSNIGTDICLFGY